MPKDVLYITCRRASDPLQAASVRGYFCRMCGLELQVSPDGRRQIAQGGVPLCNPCGGALLHKHPTTPIALNPQAEAQVARWLEQRNLIDIEVLSVAEAEKRGLI